MEEEVTPLVPSQAPLLHQIPRIFNTKTTGTRPAHWPLKMWGPSCTKLLSGAWRDNPSVVTSHPGTQRVQEFLLIQGGRRNLTIIGKIQYL